MKSYERDRDKMAAIEHSVSTVYGRKQDNSDYYALGFKVGADWCRAYMEDEIKDRDKTIAELAGALEAIANREGLGIKASISVAALTSHAEAIKRARGLK
jgi:hypothetical protein